MHICISVALLVNRLHPLVRSFRDLAAKEGKRGQSVAVGLCRGGDHFLSKCLERHGPAPFLSLG